MPSLQVPCADPNLRFEDRLFSVALPRVRDFRGISATASTQGNFSFA
jgi:ribosomal protein L5